MAEVSLVIAAVKVAAVAETAIEQATGLGLEREKKTVPERLMGATLTLCLSFR